MNGKILIASLTFLLAAMMVMPVMAKEASIVPVTAIQTAGSGTFSGVTLNDGGVFSYDLVGSGTVKLYINGATTPIVLTSNSVTNGTIDTKTNDGEIHYDTTWSLKDSEGQVLGTFEGRINGLTVTTGYLSSGYPNPFMSTNTLHGILQGSGQFEGQTLRLEGIKPAGPPPNGYPPKPTSWTGTLLTR